MHSQNRKLTLCLKDTRKFIFLTPHLARVQFLSDISAFTR